MSTMTSAEIALLTAIVEHPDEDTHRLAYADEIDEHDQPERADLIRVQVELARETVGWKPENLKCLDMYLDPQDHEDQAWKHKVQALQARESALLSAHRDKWFAVPCPACGGSGNAAEMWDNGRGAWSGACRACSGTGRIHAVPERGFAHRLEGVRMGELFARGMVVCPNCIHWRGRVPRDCLCGGDRRAPIGDWAPSQWLLNTLRALPTLREVVPSDRGPSPTRTEGGFGWWDAGQVGETGDGSDLPATVFSRMWLDHAVARREPGGEGIVLLYFATRAEAITALARAIVTVARADSARGGVR